jgi:hypothetical protein
MPKLVEAWPHRTRMKFGHALFLVMLDEGWCGSDYDDQIDGAEAAGLIAGLALDVEDAVRGAYAYCDPTGERAAERRREEAPVPRHCEKTEPCVDDVYCNCDCVDCEKMPCYRPGCRCKRSHAPFVAQNPSLVETAENRDLFALWVATHIDGFAVEALRRRWLEERWVRDPP